MRHETTPPTQEYPSRNGLPKVGKQKVLGPIALSLIVTVLLSGCNFTDRRSEGDVEEAGTSGVKVVEARREVHSVTGSDLYDRNCSVCHGPFGGGGVGPALDGNRNLANSTYVVARIQLGGGGMPPFARLLSAEEIAAVASFIRTSWQNELEPVETDQVELQWNGYRKGQRYGTRAPNEF